LNLKKLFSEIERKNDLNEILDAEVVYSLDWSFPDFSLILNKSSEAFINNKNKFFKYLKK
jgi:hypothetical protein